jgi:hypothetical protein
MRASDVARITAGVLLTCAISTAHSQSQRTPGNNAAAAAAAQQAAAAQVELATIKQQLADLQKELVAVKSERESLSAKITAASSDRQKESARADSAARELESVREMLAATQRQVSDRTATSRAAEARGAELDGQLSRLNASYSLCLSANSELAGLTHEALNRYEKVDSLSRREPFTKIAKIRAQNIADETRAAISRLTVKTATSPE